MYPCIWDRTHEYRGIAWIDIKNYKCCCCQYVHLCEDSKYSRECSACSLVMVMCGCLVSLAFAGSIGMTFVILACALPGYQKQWWPFFVVLFYVLCPIPTMIARRHSDGTGGTNSPCMETAIFITMGILVSSFGLPIVLARSAVIQWGACYLTLAGNVIVYLTILGFFTIFDMDENDYAMW